MTGREINPSTEPHVSEMQILIDAIPLQVWCALPDGSVQRQNRTLLEYVGLSPENTPRWSWRDAIHPDDLAGYLSKFASIQDTQAAGEAEVRIRRFDGEYRWFLIRVVPIQDEMGTTIRCYGTNTDIDDLKRAQEYIVARAVQVESAASEHILPSMLDAFNRLVEENERLREDFRDLFDEAPIPYVHEGVDSHFIRANRAAMSVLGIKPNEVEGIYGKSLVADTVDNQKRLSEAFAILAEGKEPVDVVLELLRKDNGKSVWVQWRSRPASNGEYTRTMMVDITERVLIEHTKAALEFTLESGQIGDWDLDLIKGTSRRSLRHDQCFGYTEPIPEADWSFDAFIQHIHSEDRARVKADFLQAANDLQNLQHEFRVVWPDGSVHWLASRGSVYRKTEGKATRILGIVMDITRRKQAEETLRATKAALEFALESAKIGDWDLDLNSDTSSRSLRHDQCFGYNMPIPEAEWGIEVFSRHLHPEDRARVVDSMRKAAQELVDWGSEFRVIWPDGSLHWLAARGSIYRTSEGKATRMLGIVTDITDRKQAEETLRSSEMLARRQVEALKGALDALAMESDPDRLVGHILQTLTEQFGAHSSSVWRRNESSGSVTFEFAFENGKVVSKEDPRFAGMDLKLPMENVWPWPEVFRAGKPSLIEDIRTQASFDLRDRLLPLGIITVLLVPMSIAGQLEGAIGLRFTEKRVFRADELELAQALAIQVMLALQLASLYAQGRESAVIAERNRLARDIHDTLAQGFTGVIVQLEAAADASSRGMDKESEKHRDRASELARESLEEARVSLRALRPSILEKNELSGALDGLFTKMAKSISVQAEFHCHGQKRSLPARWDEHLLRIAQESLTNSSRHSNAKRFLADLYYDAAEIRLELRDDGGGFDVASRHDGFGLLGIQERVDEMGGTLVIRSTSTGTTTSVRIPSVS